MKKWILAAAVSAAIVGCAYEPTKANLPQGVTLVETVALSDSGIGIPYKKYQLANGLTVVLHQDDSDPLVHVDVTYHVGSARELPGRSGFAHLFEHMMFQGSENVGDEQHFKAVTEAGGTLNGTTNSDRTNYYETVPSNQLEKMLWLESDRMGYFLPALTADKFEVQRETVKNERAQRVDNRPYGRMNERFSQAMYPKGHPYSWPVIGWPEDLERATVEDVKHFFQRWYSPNNATLTIGGDFDEWQALTWVNKYFGDIPRGADVLAESKTLVTLDKTRYVSMEDKVHLPLLRIGFPTVYGRHQDEAPLDLLANILGGGKTSIIYKNLVKEGYAVQASVSHPCSELACEMSLYALANPTKVTGLADIEGLIAQSIAEFEQRGVTDEDLQKVKVQFEASTIFGLQSVSGKVSSLAYNQTFDNNPNMIASDLARYANVTKADVMRVFNTYIKDKPMVVMSVVPEGAKQWIAHQDNFVAESVDIAGAPVPDAAVFTPAQSHFDRSLMPAAGDAPALKVPELWKAKLANGIEVMGTQSQETPTVELVIYLEGGHRLVPVEKAGLATLTAGMLNEASLKRSTEALEQALEMLGSAVEFGSSSSQSYIKVSSLTAHFDETLAIVQERLFLPKFDPADFERLKQQQLQNIQRMQAEPNYVAQMVFAELLYGVENPLGVSDDGTVASVSSLTLDDVIGFYQQQYRGANAKMVTVADLTEPQMLAKLAGFASWNGDKVPVPVLGPLPKLAGGTIYLVDKPNAAQSVISIGNVSLPYDATGDYFKAYLMNYPLGGAFNSRINLNLREDKGYTYGARSGFKGNIDIGQFMAGASVRSDVTAQALSEFITEITRYQANGMTESELSFMRSSILQGEALDYETPYQKAGFMRMIQLYGLADNFTAQQAEIIQTASLVELNALAKSLLDINQMVMVVVGDKATVEAPLRALGYPVTVLPL